MLRHGERKTNRQHKRYILVTFASHLLLILSNSFSSKFSLTFNLSSLGLLWGIDTFVGGIHREIPHANILAKEL
jgi:hypothetical protein